MAKNSRYLIFRVYTEEEVPDPDLRYSFYGWTESKAVAKAFLSQRTESKYRVRKMDMDSIAKLSEPLYDDEESNVMIDYLELESAKTHEKVKLFMTRQEMYQCEVGIQKMVNEVSSLRTVDADIEDCVEILVHLKEEYWDALYQIGYRPPEVDSMYPGSTDYSDINHIVDGIEVDYSARSKRQRLTNLYGSTSDDLYSKLLYSLENFIRVMKDDL